MNSANVTGTTTENAPAISTPAKPSVGRIVHYILPDGPSTGEHRPAIIVKVWNDTYPGVQLQVFTDGSNDGNTHKSGLFWATSVPYADPSENTPRTWHWPEFVPAK
jgi:hypothetical protein